MKKIIGKRVEEEVLRCEICKKVIGKSMWRAFVDGIIIEDGDCEGLDFCSKKCSMKWIKENVMTEKIKTSQVKGYKQNVDGELYLQCGEFEIKNNKPTNKFLCHECQQSSKNAPETDERMEDFVNQMKRRKE